MSLITGTPSAQYPYRLLHLRKASIRTRSCAEVRPDHTSEQYFSFAIMFARKTSVSDVASSPSLQRTLIAYNDLEHDASISVLTWSVAINLSFSVMPCSAVRLDVQTGRTKCYQLTYFVYHS